MKRQTVIRRIKALLRLSRGTTFTKEAQSALLNAKTLKKKYRVSNAELGFTEKRNRDEDERVIVKGKVFRGYQAQFLVTALTGGDLRTLKLKDGYRLWGTWAGRWGRFQIVALQDLYRIWDDLEPNRLNADAKEALIIHMALQVGHAVIDVCNRVPWMAVPWMVETRETQRTHDERAFYQGPHSRAKNQGPRSAQSCAGDIAEQEISDLDGPEFTDYRPRYLKEKGKPGMNSDLYQDLKDFLIDVDWVKEVWDWVLTVTPYIPAERQITTRGRHAT